VFEGWDRVMAEQMGLEVNYFSLRDTNPVLDYYTPVLIAGEEVLETDLLARFLRASARGFEFAKNNPTAAAEILHKHAPEMDLNFLTASQEFLSAAYFSSSWGYINEDRWNNFFYWMRDNGFIPATSENRAFAQVDF